MSASAFTGVPVFGHALNIQPGRNVVDPPPGAAKIIRSMATVCHRTGLWIDANGRLMRLSPAGELRWARRYAATVNSVTSDGSRIVVTGTYTGALDFDDDGKIEREADQDEYHEGVVAVLDPNGDLLHTFTIVGEDSDASNAAAFSPDGERLHVTGYTKLGADFSGDGVIESESAGHQLGDVYLAVYNVED